MDKELLQKIKDIESLTEKEKTKIYELIDMAISYHKTKNYTRFYRGRSPDFYQKYRY